MERKYALTRIGTGDYMFLSNNGQRLWRVSSYHEDGSICDGPLEGTTAKFWQASKFRGTLDQAETLMKLDPEEFLSWDRWDPWAHLIPTRREAIEDALKADKTAALREP